jgi:hypothetical protein
MSNTLSLLEDCQDAISSERPVSNRVARRVGFPVRAHLKRDIKVGEVEKSELNS